MPRKSTGRITRLPNGKYKVRAAAGTLPNGKRNILNRTVTTKKEAEYLLKTFLHNAEITKNKHSNTDILRLSIEDYFVDVFLPHKQRTLKAQSYMRLESTVRVHIIPNHGHISVGSIKSEDIELLLDRLFKSGKSYSTIKKVYDAYHAMFNYLVNQKHDMDIHDNPMDSVKLMSQNKFDNTTIKWFNPDEVIKIHDECMRKSAISNIPIYRYGSMFMLIMNSGLREGEACALMKNDIDFEQKTITVSKNVYVDKVYEDNGDTYYNVEIGTVKYANSERIVAVSDTALDYCRQLIDQFPETEMLIYNDKRGLVRPATLSKSFSKVLMHLGIQNGSLHSLRHTYVSMLFDADVDIYTIAAQIGDDPNTVMKTYLHLYQKRKAIKIDGIDVVERAKNMLTDGVDY